MKYIAFLSFGKDSTATLIEIMRRGLPLDEVVYVDIRYSKEISGEHPRMAAWIPTAERIILNEFGIKVRHLKSKYTFKDYFYTKKVKGDHIGDIYGFPFVIGAWCNSRLKTKAIDQYINSLKDQVTEYVGIAFDEPERYKALQAKQTAKITYKSVLYENEITENQAFGICEEYNLVSPTYTNGGFRGGCWFCVKQALADLYELWRDYPEYFNELLELEKDSRNTFKPRITLKQLEEKFKNGYVPKRKKTRRKEDAT